MGFSSESPDFSQPEWSFKAMIVLLASLRLRKVLPPSPQKFPPLSEGEGGGYDGRVRGFALPEVLNREGLALGRLKYSWVSALRAPRVSAGCGGRKHCM